MKILFSLLAFCLFASCVHSQEAVDTVSRVIGTGTLVRRGSEEPIPMILLDAHAPSGIRITVL